MMLLLALFSLFPLDELSWPVAFRIRGNLLYTLDYPSHQLLVWDWQECKKIAAIGAPGQGPGELSFPDTFWLKNTQFQIFSRIQKTISIFDAKGVFVADQKVPWLNGYPMLRTEQGLLVLGTPAEEGFEDPLIKVYSNDGEVLDSAVPPSTGYIKAKGILQDFYFAEGPNGTFFFGDPFEPLKLQWRRLSDLSLVKRIAIPFADAVTWDGLSKDLPEPYGLNTGWGHDRFHAPAPGFYFSCMGQDFLVVTLIRGTSLKDAAFFTLVLELDEGFLVQSYQSMNHYPIGSTDRNSILLFGEDDDGYFLRETPIREFLEGVPGGR